MSNSFLYFKIGVTRVRVTVEYLNGEPAPIAVERFDPEAMTFAQAPQLMKRVNSLDAVKISEDEFFAR